ncbi:hypothetical protein NA57DRAFT_33341 [Rhizodiscina lignyota]|uniref:EH domain-containing protein n=1 Tax=Rhizodiscina lignyota TaxID=1504668 RepID=A0A9P4IMF4_9PEZI|nr:hypothetical protein NA57DRAFT_33341 [Rhizodiscina lignyota]
MEDARTRRPHLEHKTTDDTPIPPTNTLVKLFEQNNQGQISGRSQPPKARRPPPVAPKPTVPEPSSAAKQPSVDHVQRTAEPQLGAKISRPDAPPSRGRPLSRDGDHQPRPSTATKHPVTQASKEAPELKAKPDLPAPRRAARKSTQDDEPMKSSPRPIPPQRQVRKSASNISLPETGNRTTLGLSPPTQYQKQSLPQISPHITGDSLANAIVGAHLASSRNHSPTRSSTATPLPPLPRRDPRNHHHHEYNPLNRLRSRSPSPTKSPERKPVQLRTTLRKDATSSSEEGRGKHGRGRKHIWRKHPNKHHEGDRKRWRDSITERERKRYEGVWAANKGLYIQPSQSTASLDDQADDVLDLVVREIWSRSRLPAAVLAEIWDLVDRRGEGRLNREQFVVGMWLVDQSLKGRKVPRSVMESVWASVRLAGVKLKKKNFQ